MKKLTILSVLVFTAVNVQAEPEPFFPILDLPINVRTAEYLPNVEIWDTRSSFDGSNSVHDPIKIDNPPIIVKKVVAKRPDGSECPLEMAWEKDLVFPLNLHQDSREDSTDTLRSIKL